MKRFQYLSSKMGMLRSNKCAEQTMLGYTPEVKFPIYLSAYIERFDVINNVIVLTTMNIHACGDCGAMMNMFGDFLSHVILFWIGYIAYSSLR